MTSIEWISCLLIASGAVFFAAGSAGLLRFPDIYSRLHALTKADNLGLGFIAAGLILQAGSWRWGVKLLLIWLLVLVASATICCLIAGSARENAEKAEGKR